MERGFLVRLKAAAKAPVELAKQRSIRLLFEIPTVTGALLSTIATPGFTFTLRRVLTGAAVGFGFGFMLLLGAALNAIESESAKIDRSKALAAKRQGQRDFISKWGLYVEEQKLEGKTADINKFLDELEYNPGEFLDSIQ